LHLTQCTRNNNVLSEIFVYTSVKIARFLKVILRILCLVGRIQTKLTNLRMCCMIELCHFYKLVMTQLTSHATEPMSHATELMSHVTLSKPVMSHSWAPSWSTGQRRPIKCLKLQVIFRKRPTNYRALWRKMTYNDKASYGFSPPCRHGAKWNH